MKEPENLLPLEFIYNGFKDSFIYSHELKMNIAEHVIDSEEGEYIVQAANMFPEAIRLIRMSEVYLKFLKKEDSLEYQQLKHFLTKLEEDEKRD